ncbi:MAG: hypothetical protein H0T56_10920 [Pseudaminobacter sp.]|nr:hypothetical protein [Pseudaminobacter sp.]
MAIKFVVKEEPRHIPERSGRKSPSPVLDSEAVTVLADNSGEAASVAGSDLFDSEPNAPGRKRRRK